MGIARTRVELHGTVSNDQDTWSTSFAIPSQDALSDSSHLGLAHAINDSFIANFWISTERGLDFAPETKYLGVRLRDIDADDRTTRVSVYDATGNQPGTSGANQLPAECAVCVSLVSARAGARGRGRMYLPPPAVSVIGENGVLTPFVQTEFTNAMGAFFNDFNTHLVPGGVSVYSAADAAIRPVKTVKIGSVVDSQRRRRNAQMETYDIATL